MTGRDSVPVGDIHYRTRTRSRPRAQIQRSLVLGILANPRPWKPFPSELRPRKLPPPPPWKPPPLKPLPPEPLPWAEAKFAPVVAKANRMSNVAIVFGAMGSPWRSTRAPGAHATVVHFAADELNRRFEQKEHPKDADFVNGETSDPLSAVRTWWECSLPAQRGQSDKCRPADGQDEALASSALSQDGCSLVRRGRRMWRLPRKRASFFPHLRPA